MLKLMLLAASLLIFSATSQAQSVYSWRDARGVLNYSDVPPPEGARDVKKLRITHQSGIGGADRERQGTTRGPGAATPGAATGGESGWPRYSGGGGAESGGGAAGGAMAGPGGGGGGWAAAAAGAMAKGTSTPRGTSSGTTTATAGGGTSAPSGTTPAGGGTSAPSGTTTTTAAGGTTAPSGTTTTTAAGGTPTPSGTTTTTAAGGTPAPSGTTTTTAAGGTSAPSGTITFPRLLGMNIGAKNYDNASYQRDLARLDVVILGFYRGWNPGGGYAANSPLAIQKVVQTIKAINPKILVGNYTILNEAPDIPNDSATLDLQAKLNATNWWLRNAAGQRVQWTTGYGAWDINYSAWAKPDANGQRWPQWKADRDFSVYFRDVPEFDVWYLDNRFVRPRVTADWDMDGVDDNPADPRILSVYYAGHLAEGNRIRTLHPKIMLIGNTADTDLSNVEWRGQLEGGFLEAIMGESWSIETWGGWPKMMEVYRAQMANLKAPKILGFGVQGNPTDYRFFRYAYTSCLLDDGYFAFTDRSRQYRSVPWFDEYDFKLGNALTAPPAVAWSNFVWRRDFQNGIVLVNSTTTSRTVDVGLGVRRLAGTQDAAVNDGSSVLQITLGPKDGIVLRR